ncbi:hypothetical protein DL95DRAFT_383528 [Leptodontidium sp. 2 PMI_412]|nr:hypothetical protein DL95DRAFT_383528 [Leptodontidium sp. 2 PMI_412]
MKEYLEFWRDVNLDDLLETHIQLSSLANAYVTALSHNSLGIIVLPATIFQPRAYHISTSLPTIPTQRLTFGFQLPTQSEPESSTQQCSTGNAWNSAALLFWRTSTRHTSSPEAAPCTDVSSSRMKPRSLHQTRRIKTRLTFILFSRYWILRSHWSSSRMEVTERWQKLALVRTWDTLLVLWGTTTLGNNEVYCSQGI